MNNIKIILSLQCEDSGSVFWTSVHTEKTKVEPLQISSQMS